MKPRLFQRRTGAETQFEELRKVLDRLKTCRFQVRSAVGAGVGMANKDFLQRFKSIESFRRSPAIEQEQFWSDLADLELGLRSQEAGMALGVGLYRIWLADKLAGEHDVAELLGEELSELSRKW